MSEIHHTSKHLTSFFLKEKIRKQNNSWDSEENIIFNDTLISEELNIFFQNTTKTLNINENSYIVDSSSSITDRVDKAIKIYKNCPRILLIKQKLENVEHVSLKLVSISKTEKELRQLNSNKATTFGNTPTKILRENSKSCSDTL